MENMSLNSQFYFLKNAMRILLPLSVFSLMFSQYYLIFPSLFNSFNEFSSNFSIQLFTYSSERNYIFLLCNGILVFIIKNSGLISTTNISDNHHHYPKESKIQETKIESLEKVVEIEKQEKEEEIETMNIQDDLVGVETIDENEVYQEFEDSKSFLQNNQLGYHSARYVEVIEEFEEVEEFEEEETLEELHKKCDDFIKRIKKEINRKN
ncbi:hypothetical protein EJD97_020605 [Solanum chilense]|uniref:DUF4408 domain-containing protein n=1 Tax=Solanum chilense TaxID=4083 RepID=A0A6N2B132_SOLCI|nr:hypothetical protein EJD97_020605 [Solanum chilense]